MRHGHRLVQDILFKELEPRWAGRQAFRAEPTAQAPGFFDVPQLALNFARSPGGSSARDDAHVARGQVDITRLLA